MSKELTDVKAEIKHWEHTFKDTHGREPTRDDIKANPVIVEKYKLYNKLKKKAEEQPDVKPSRKSPRTPSPPSSRSAKHPTTIIGSKACPTASSTSLDTKNPFSPAKKKKERPDEPARTVWNPFMTPVKSAPAPTSAPPPEPMPPNIFQQPVKEPNMIISKARKRLRGDSVSPSPPQRNKHIRVEGIMQNTAVDQEGEDDGFMEESPAKPTANGKSFQPLFNDISSQPSTSTENRGRTFTKAKTISGGLFGGAIRDDKTNIAQDFLPVDPSILTKGKGKAIEAAAVMPTIKKRKTLPGPKGLIPSKDNLFEEQSSTAQLPSSQVPSSRKRTISKVARETAKKPPLESNAWNLLPPSPPAEGKKFWNNATTKMKKQKLVEKARHDDDEDDESDVEIDDVDIVGWHETSNSRQVHGLNLEIDPELRIQLRPGASTTRAKSKSPEPEIFDVELPEHMVNMLSLSPKHLANEKEDEDLAKGVIQGRRRGGTEVWGPGEFGGESEGSEERRNEEQDDWEGEGVPWEIGEL